MSLRLGVERHDRPLEVVAVAEARVIAHELGRRLGDVTLDLRIDGARIGPWLPASHASWPVDVDVVVDTDVLWNDALPPLTHLFGRTIQPEAAEVRARMLHHLAVLPTAEFAMDDALLARLVALRVRPTDLWIVARRAQSINVDDPAIRALGAPPHDDATTLVDTAFDGIASSLAPERAPTIGRLATERDDAVRRSVAMAEELARDRAELADRLDALSAENEVLRERLERAELHRRITS